MRHSNPRFAPLLIVVVGVTAFSNVTHAQSKKIAGNNVHLKLNCGQKAIEIVGNSNVIALSGACGPIVVGGNSNSVSAQATASVEVQGNSNAVSLGKVNRVSALGNSNVVRWSKKANPKTPKVFSVGNGNRVVAVP